MSRLASAVKMDVLVQSRYGFYYAAAFVSIVWIVLLRALPDAALSLAVPLVVFTDLGIIGFYFVAGQIVFEKSERTLSAVIVTPLTLAEYIASKIVTLTLLAWVVSFVVAVASYGFGFDIALFSLGVVFTSVIILLVGIIGIAPYRSISPFMLPSQFYFAVLFLPIISFIGWVESPLFYLFPTQGALLLLTGAFSSISWWEIVYSVLYQALWVALLVHFTRVRFNRYIVMRAGGE